MKGAENIPAARIALGIASLALVLWLLTQQVDKVSPGPLAAAHLQEPELLERGACERCHGTHAVSMAEACAGCHANVARDIREARGFHGTLANIDARECARCHGEHSGEEFELVSQRSFRLAGFATREAYDHAELDFLLQGRHTQLACTDCHANADVVLIARGQQRFAGLEQGCQSCHEDAHQGRIARACADCHGQEHPFSLVASFEHESFGSQCAHGAVSCQTCHPRGGPHDAELLAGADPPDLARDCLDCHLSPHGESFTVGVAALLGGEPGASCAACHDEAHGAFPGHPEASPPELHVASGFELDAPHNTLACDACHRSLDGDELSFSIQVPPREADACQACHGDPHDGQFDDGPLGPACLDCHARDTFVPCTFGPAEHGRSNFPLVASHEAVACDRCHQPAQDGAPPRFEGASTVCSDCHADAHHGAFDERLERLDSEPGCAHCHQPTLFSQYEEASFEHGEWTGFALVGAHARAECESCHERSARADGSGRTFGVASALFGPEVERCVTCHVDAHAGSFDRPGLPVEVDGRADCARCHSSESFTELSHEPFDHERWTGYPMAGFHEQVECAECHQPTARPDESGRRFGRAPKLCQDCHTDPHVGQFALAGVTDCARCHLDAGGNKFDHQRDSRFPLDERHADVACAKCHVPWPLHGGGEAVRYKPLGTECVDCHDPDFVERSRRSDPEPKTRRSGSARRGGGG